MVVHLVTKTPKKYDLKRVIKHLNLTELNDEMPEAVDTIIIHSFDEDTYTSGILLENIINTYGIKKVLYLQDHPELHLAAIVRHYHGLVDTEDYLDDDDALNDLIQHMADLTDEATNQSQAVLAMDNELAIVNTFFRDVSLGELDIQNTGYIQSVKRAIHSLQENNTQSKAYTATTERTLVDTFNRAFENIQAVSDELDKARQENQTMDEKLSRLQGLTLANEDENSLQSFSSYRVSDDYGARFVVFKEYSEVRYLTSFVMGYKNYLENKQNKRVRLIFIIPNKYTWLEKYERSDAMFEHYAIEQNRYMSESAIKNKVGYCEKPINRMYDYFANKLSDDFLLIVDRTHDSKPAVVGKVDTFHCFSGKSESDLYPNIKDHRIFTMKGVSSDDITIPHFSNYPKLASERVKAYDSKPNINELYHKLDELIVLNR